MQNREAFRWTFTASGLWLILSPFMLLGGQSALSNALVGDAGLLILSGLLALTVAGYGHNKHYLVQTYLGVSYGLILVAAPWLFGFTEPVTAWNAGVVGTALVLAGLYVVFQKMPKHHA
ncbi:SPW repeat protein [uncultured Tateyamaria sp.]|uniref:SPW repeat domain-containing protein n=1 Tax=uncultured Tateyamaria sp. TaxID=455651 RepID=UPI002606AEB4|nr:SPW repeat protein [uncultured Tateyamaria sp.]